MESPLYMYFFFGHRKPFPTRKFNYFISFQVQLNNLGSLSLIIFKGKLLIILLLPKYKMIIVIIITVSF